MPYAPFPMGIIGGLYLAVTSKMLPKMLYCINLPPWLKVAGMLSIPPAAGAAVCCGSGCASTISVSAAGGPLSILSLAFFIWASCYLSAGIMLSDMLRARVKDWRFSLVNRSKFCWFIFIYLFHYFEILFFSCQDVITFRYLYFNKIMNENRSCNGFQIDPCCYVELAKRATGSCLCRITLVPSQIQVNLNPTQLIIISKY